MRTRLSALPIADKIAELMIGHAQSGLHQIYDQHRHTQEKRRGFVLWQNALLATVEPERSNVPIREPAAAGRKVVVREIA